jgi:type II secretory pathway pseudopilin PulG
MIVVAIIGVLAGLTALGVRKYLHSARTSEALTNVGRMAKDASTAYALDRPESIIRKNAIEPHRLCVSASRTVPRRARDVRGKKYQSSPAEWQRDGAAQQKGFACLHFSIESPQYYLYQYRTSRTNWRRTGREGTTFEALAQGDLNGDGRRSSLSLTGEVTKTDGKFHLRVAPNIAQVDPDE